MRRKCDTTMLYHNCLSDQDEESVVFVPAFNILPMYANDADPSLALLIPPFANEKCIFCAIPSRTIQSGRLAIPAVGHLTTGGQRRVGLRPTSAESP